MTTARRAGDAWTQRAPPGADRADHKRARPTPPAERLLGQIVTHRTPPHVRNLLRVYLDHTRVPSTMDVHLLGLLGQSRLANCTYVGCGSDGAVFRWPTISRQRLAGDTVVLKVRELFDEFDWGSTCREALQGHVALAARALFVVGVERLEFWRGESTTDVREQRGCNAVSRHVNHLLARERTAANYVIELLELMDLPETRLAAMRDWCMAHAPECPDAAPRLAGVRRRHADTAQLLAQRASIEAAYAWMRAEYLARKPCRQVYALLHQRPGGEFSLDTRLVAHATAELGDCWLAPAHWPTLRAHVLTLAHMLYVLQRTAGFMHGDLTPKNIVLRAERFLPGELRAFWLPEDRGARDAAGRPCYSMRPLTVEQLHGLVPSLIDLSRSSFSSCVAAEALHISAAPGTAELAPVAVLVARPHRYSRIVDLQRLGLYLCLAVASCMHRDLAAGAVSARRDCQPWLRERFDWRALTAIMCLFSVPADWLELARDPDAGGAAKFSQPAGLATRKTPSFREFVGKMLAVQQYLRVLLRLVHPQTRDTDATRQAAGELVARHLVGRTRAVSELLEHLVFDLNPFSHYALRHGCQEWPDNPLLPEQVLAWRVWTASADARPPAAS